MLHAGLDPSRKRLDVCLVSERASSSRRSSRQRTPTAARPGAQGRQPWEAGGRGDRVDDGARFVHDSLAQLGWDVEIADAQKLKRLAPSAGTTDRIDARVLARSPTASWCRRSGCPIPESAASASRPAPDCSWSSIGSQLKHRIHARLMSLGKPCPVTDLLGVEGRTLLDHLEIAEPW
jgi:hypothetical protein